ncbi:MAG: hypothetical protein NUV81_02555 [bacterium]|nr:hypothetical protein [bacterium]
MQSNRIAFSFILIAIACIVGGFFLVSRPNSKQNESLVVQMENPGRHGDVLVMVNDEHSVSVWKEDGTEIDAPEGFVRLEAIDTIVPGVHFFSGVPVGVHSNKRIDNLYRVLSPDQKRELRPGSAREDGAMVVEIGMGDATEEHVIRFQDGKTVQDGEPVGWWDSQTFGVVGRLNGERHILAVALSGSVHDVAVLPDIAEQIVIQNGALWYVTLTPGPGLESPPEPPSTLHSVALGGEDTVVYTFKNDAIRRFIIGSTGDIAIQGESGTTEYLKGIDVPASSIEKGMPLLFVREGELLLRRDNSLFLRDVESKKEISLGTYTGFDPIVSVLPAEDIDENQ